MAATSSWQPQEEGFKEICGFLEQQMSPTSDKSQILQQLHHYSRYPDFNNYLAFILARAEGKPMEVRQAAGLLLKNNLRAAFKSMASPYQQYIKSELLPCLGAADRHIRSTAGTIISELVQIGGVFGWPELFHTLVQCLDSNNLNQMEGAMDALSKMVDHIPHDGGSPRVENEPDIMPLPPRIRPFDPERYHPQEHVLPPSTFDHFTDFARRAPWDLLLREPESRLLLLREPESHLSHHARKVGSRFTLGYGSIIAKEWYTELPGSVRHIVDEAGFGPFCKRLSRFAVSRTLLGALVERWWDTTNSFHFSATGDMTMTPYDFAMLTGLDVGGRPILYDFDMGEWEAAWTYLLGAHPPIDRSSGTVRYTWFTEQYRGTVPETVEATEQYARGFLMFLLGTTLFSDRGKTVELHLLSALVDLSQVRHFDWGGAGLATLYYYMSASSRGHGNIVGGYWRAWELWVCAYFPTLVPDSEVKAPLEIPYSHRFESQCRSRPRKTLPYLRHYFDTVRATEITWQPWVVMPRYSRFQFPGAWGASRYRILFEGPVGRAWFLGERFMRQTLGNPTQDIPSPPPANMRTTDSLTPREVSDFMQGANAVFFLEEGEYTTYLHTYLMPPLTGVRAPMRRAADISSSSRTRATDIFSTSRASTLRGGTKRMPPTWQRAGWPDPPTELTSWRYGTPYQIPLEPSLLDHRYFSAPDSAPPSRGYAKGLLKAMASLEFMVLRREMILHSYDIPVTPVQPKPLGPSRVAGRGIPTRGRERRRAPARRDDESSEEEDPAHPQLETSAGRGGDTGSGSEGGDDAKEDSGDGSSDSDGGVDDGGVEAAQPKRVKRTSRS